MRITDSAICVWMMLLAVALCVVSDCVAGEHNLRIHVVNVRGDAILIQAPSGKNMLVDASTSDNAPQLVKYLKGIGVEEIDTFVITHAHLDHIGGAEAVLTNFKVKRVVANPDSKMTIGRISPATPFISPVPGDRLDIDSLVEIVVLFPPEFPGEDTPKDDPRYLYYKEPSYIRKGKKSALDYNSTCIVFRLSYAGRTFLFTGDIMYEAQLEMLRIPPSIVIDGKPVKDLLKSDVLKVNHHGLLSFQTRDYLHTVAPTYAIIPNGRFPLDPVKHKANHERITETLRILDEAGIKTYITTDGPIVCICTPSGELRFEQ